MFTQFLTSRQNKLNVIQHINCNHFEYWKWNNIEHKVEYLTKNFFIDKTPFLLLIYWKKTFLFYCRRSLSYTQFVQHSLLSGPFPFNNWNSFEDIIIFWWDIFGCLFISHIINTIRLFAWHIRPKTFFFLFFVIEKNQIFRFSFICRYYCSIYENV